MRKALRCTRSLPKICAHQRNSVAEKGCPLCFSASSVVQGFALLYFVRFQFCS
jgi:hypothetical protein